MVREILIVEDDPVSSALISKQLKSNGFHIHNANHGREALEILKRKHIDLIITDVVMPIMDGVDLCMELKTSEATTDIPVIIMTENDMFRRAFLTMGVNHFIEKPYHIDTLLQQVRNIEKNGNATRQYVKVVVAGQESSVLMQMLFVLRSGNFLAADANGFIELFHKIFVMRPHIILLDMVWQEHVRTYEIITALRSFSFLNNTSILIFNTFDAQDIDESLPQLHEIKEEIDRCLKAGAENHIGHFSSTTLMDQLKNCQAYKDRMSSKKAI